MRMARLDVVYFRFRKKTPGGSANLSLRGHQRQEVEFPPQTWQFKRAMKFTYYGHACFGMETGGANLLFDPFISPNELAAGIDIASIPADAILVSHGHADHLADAAAIAKRTAAPIISNWEIVDWFGRQGIENGHPMNHGGSWQFPFGRVKYTNAIHSSGLPDGSYGGNPGGFVVKTPDTTFYYSGDTALTLDMKLIAEEFDLAFAILPVGDNFTMGPADALRAANFLGVDRVVGVHFDTFPYIRIDHEKSRDLFAAGGKTLLLPKIGETLDL
jgi:L-ascorbate metabolism protein UlaG (beta-lactamase superfamily)